MKRTSKTARGKRQQRTGPVPSGGSAGWSGVGLPDQPDTDGSDPAQWPDPRVARDPAQTDIERASERKGGSVEGITDAPPVAGLSGFSEPADGNRPDPGSAPFLREA